MIRRNGPSLPGARPESAKDIVAFGHEEIAELRRTEARRRGERRAAQRLVRGHHVAERRAVVEHVVPSEGKAATLRAAAEVKADTRKLYKMRYVNLPQSSYISMATGLQRSRIMMKSGFMCIVFRVGGDQEPMAR